MHYSLAYKRGNGEDHFRAFRDNELWYNGYSDSDWANDVEQRRSTTGYLFSLFPGEFIAHNSSLQHVVSLSVFEAEYIALVHAVKEGTWISRLVKEMFLNLLDKDLKVVLRMFVDNKGTVQFANQPRISRRSKHIEVRYHWINKQVEKKTLVIIHVPSDLNLSNFLTKPLGSTAHLNEVSRTMITKRKNQKEHAHTIVEEMDVEEGEIPY